MENLKDLQDMLKSYQKSLRAIRAHKVARRKTKKYKINKQRELDDADETEKYYLKSIADYQARIVQKLKEK